MKILGGNCHPHCTLKVRMGGHFLEKMPSSLYLESEEEDENIRWKM